MYDSVNYAIFIRVTLCLMFFWFSLAFFIASIRLRIWSLHLPALSWLCISIAFAMPFLYIAPLVSDYAPLFLITISVVSVLVFAYKTTGYAKIKQLGLNYLQIVFFRY